MRDQETSNREAELTAITRIGSGDLLCGNFVDKLIRGDCLEVMKSMPDGCVDAVITDPPYCSGSVSEASRTAAKGQGLRSKNIQRLGWFVGDNMGTAGLVWLIRSMAVESLRLLKGNGSLLIFYFSVKIKLY